MTLVTIQVLTKGAAAVAGTNSGAAADGTNDDTEGSRRLPGDAMMSSRVVRGIFVLIAVNTQTALGEFSSLSHSAAMTNRCVGVCRRYWRFRGQRRGSHGAPYLCSGLCGWQGWKQAPEAPTAVAGRPVRGET